MEGCGGVAGWSGVVVWLDGVVWWCGWMEWCGGVAGWKGVRRLRVYSQEVFNFKRQLLSKSYSMGDAH